MTLTHNAYCSCHRLSSQLKGWPQEGGVEAETAPDVLDKLLVATNIIKSAMLKDKQKRNKQRRALKCYWSGWGSSGLVLYAAT